MGSGLIIHHGLIIRTLRYMYIYWVRALQSVMLYLFIHVFSAICRFTHVFDHRVKQEEVFEVVAEGVIDKYVCVCVIAC